TETAITVAVHLAGSLVSTLGDDREIWQVERSGMQHVAGVGITRIAVGHDRDAETAELVLVALEGATHGFGASAGVAGHQLPQLRQGDTEPPPEQRRDQVDPALQLGFLAHRSPLQWRTARTGYRKPGPAASPADRWQAEIGV